MDKAVFAEARFWLLAASSAVIPLGIYVVLLRRRVVSPRTVLLLGLVLVAISGVDAYLLQSLSAAARRSVSPADDALFASEVTLGLYLLPALFGGVGINLVSHVLIRHLNDAESRFDAAHPPRDG